MGHDLVKLGRQLGRFFRERQIYHRSDGVVRFIKLTSKTQIVLTLVIGASLLWVAYASVNVVFKEQIIVANEKERQRQIDAYRTQIRSSEKAYKSINELNVIFSQEYEAAISQLETRHETLREIVENKKNSDQGFAALADTLSEVGGPDGHKMLNGNRVMVDSIGREPTPRQSRTSRVQQKSMEYAITSELSRGAKNDVLMKMRRSTAELTAQQQLLLAKIETDIHREIDELQQIIRSTGINDEALILPVLRTYAARRSNNYEDLAYTLKDQESTGSINTNTKTPLTAEEGPTPLSDDIYSGQGGPLITYYGEQMTPDISYFRTAQRVANTIEEAAVIAGIIEKVPLSTPISVRHRLTSKYGPRWDPKNRKVRANHYGLDLAGPWNSPIIATAPGRIKFAGFKSGFGRVVEIDHENGFITRYAHLNKIKVKAGQRVKLHDTIGLLGSSGRSTGPHVHYEVRFRGQPIDPIKFIKAGRYVFES